MVDHFCAGIAGPNMLGQRGVSWMYPADPDEGKMTWSPNTDDSRWPLVTWRWEALVVNCTCLSFHLWGELRLSIFLGGSLLIIKTIFLTWCSRILQAYIYTQGCLASLFWCWRMTLVRRSEVSYPMFFISNMCVLYSWCTWLLGQNLRTWTTDFMHSIQLLHIQCMYI